MMARTPRRRNVGQSSTRGRQRSARDEVENTEDDVYQSMLADATTSSPTRVGDEGQTVKKRRVGGRLVVQEEASVREQDIIEKPIAQERRSLSVGDGEGACQAQTVFKDFSDSEESDMDWEDVNLQGTTKKDDAPTQLGDLNLVLDTEDQSPGNMRRKPLTTSEKKLRLDIHKMHLLCLLSHVHLRNYWCNSTVVHKKLKRHMPKQAREYLDDKESNSQFQRTRDFIEGLKSASEAFKQIFKITARGNRRPYWAASPEHLAEFELPDDIDLPLEKSDFIGLASKPEASRDVIAQLFCAVLRSVGVETRLVCSLQPLLFVNAAKTATPAKPKYTKVVEFQDTDSAAKQNEHYGLELGASPARMASASSADFRANLIRSKVASRLGRPILQSNQNTAPKVTPPKPAPRKRRIIESGYPVYWVEAFNPANQKWIPIDPIVTNTIGKTTKFEPPANDGENIMSYVIAFEEDGSARDVTRRYVKAPNAKTRKLRVESTKGGTRWWKQAMRLYRRSYPLDRDQVEDAELTGKEAQEEMPKNVQDFKDHPYYALERHLRRNEALHSKREVGKVSSGKGADGDKKLESIYRRRDVHTVKSADSWYRLGREIKPGEIPLKFVRPRQKLGHDIDEEDQAAEHRDVPRVGMFAGFQTSIYIPPPVVRGRIPKNIYGNLDVYVPTMIPPGAVHITHPDTMRAARLIGIDYADAVVGFEFKGRQGTAVVKGAIVASEYQEAICDIIQGFAEEMIEEELTRRGLIALKLWRRLLLRLRIKERIDGYDIEGENGDDAEEMDETFDEEEVDAEEDEGPTISASVEPLKIDIVYPPSTRRSDKADLFTDEARGLTPAQVPRGDKSISGGVQDGRGFINENTNTDTRIIADEAIEGGGFMTDDIIEDDQQAMVHGALPDPLGDDTAGGFLPAEDLEEARLLQQVYEAEAKERDAKSTVESKVLDTTMDIDQDIEKTEEDTEEAEEESDKGSLLSHDPEDEDADPDWLI